MNRSTASDMLHNDLVAMVSHELRSPLTTVKATVKLVAAGVTGETSAEQQRLLTLALGNIERMSRIVNQLLDISKIEAGRLELHPERVDLVALLQDAGHSFKPLMDERGLALHMDVPHTRIESFLDRDKIIQVLSNLLHNAVKFTPAGTITLGVREETDSLVVSVTDTGPGFRAEDLPFVFGKFKRFSSPHRQEDQGSGLGLSLCKKLVELHGGMIRLESQPGLGSRFEITLPRLSAEEVFREEALRLMKRADETAKPLSIAEIVIDNWSEQQEALGPDASGTLLNYFEAQLKASLRDESDFVVQRPGALWIAVFSAPLMEAQQVLKRLEQKVQGDAIAHISPLPLNLKLQLFSYPQDSRKPEDILNLLTGSAAR